MQDQKIQVLIVGATGKLGSLITKHCLAKPNLNVNILVRNPDKLKELCEEVKAKGGQVIVGDMLKQDTLKDSTKGIHTIISALIGDDNTVLEGQRALLKDAQLNGVKRFLPSDFSLDYKKVNPEEHTMLAQRINFKEDLKKTDIKGIHVLNGIFMETFWYVFKKSQKPGSELVMGCFDNADYKFDTTTYDDTAKFVAEIVSDPEAAGIFEIIGQTLTCNEVASIYEKVKKAKINIKIIGTYDNLITSRDEAQKSGNFFKYIGLAYMVPTVDERGRLFEPKHQNYGIKTTSVEDFLVSRPDL